MSNELSNNLEEITWFNATFQNPVIDEILSNGKYQSAFPDYHTFDILEFTFEGSTLVGCEDDITRGFIKAPHAGIGKFTSYGVSTLEQFTKTLMSFLMYFGTAEKEIENNINNRMNDICKGFVSLKGFAAVQTEEDDWGSPTFEGYDFLIENGKYSADFRICEGGW